MKADTAAPLEARGDSYLDDRLTWYGGYWLFEEKSTRWTYLFDLVEGKDYCRLTSLEQARQADPLFIRGGEPAGADHRPNRRKDPDCQGCAGARRRDRQCPRMRVRGRPRGHGQGRDLGSSPRRDASSRSHSQIGKGGKVQLIHVMPLTIQDITAFRPSRGASFQTMKKIFLPSCPDL